MKSTIVNVLCNIPTSGPLLAAVATFVFAQPTDVDFLCKLIDHKIEAEVIRNASNILKGIR